MKIKIKSFNKNPKKHIKFFKDRGFLVLENVLSQRDFKDINKLIINTASIYLNKKLKYKDLDSPNFNKELIKLRKKSKKKFALFFDTLQTSIALYKLWSSERILKTITKIMETKIDFISATDMLVRVDSPIDKRNKLEWHQDSAYFRQNNSGYNGLNCWAPLINLSLSMGPLEFLENSHKAGSIKVSKERAGRFKSLQRKIPEATIKKFNIKKFKLKRGDIIFMNMDTIHRSGENISKLFRMSSICRYHNTRKKDFNPGLNIYRYSDKRLNKKIHGF
ncbi:phytanoyl-CoA dioxygenase family protein [Pelagibacteraceae bacterium]|jgi:ectoine hydroxylase-related dioxygenase (phytanoyl-CoA dioxygenase family)|nr:phytanoyl-CoA dioxygenase family protein [Pelagibacteraceae bacterium]